MEVRLVGRGPPCHNNGQWPMHRVCMGQALQRLRARVAPIETRRCIVMGRLKETTAAAQGCLRGHAFRGVVGVKMLWEAGRHNHQMLHRLTPPHTAWPGMAWPGMAWHDKAWHGMA